MLRASPGGALVRRAVSRAVGNPRHDDPSLLDPVAGAGS